MQERFTELIFAYQTRVREALALFEQHKGITQLMDWRRNGLPRAGFVDPAQTIEYYFHGIGCCVDLPGGPVDWDFGHDGRTDGFDSWRLWQFADEGTPDFPEFKHKETLETAFAEAKAQGVICRPYRDRQDRLYYFCPAAH